MRGNGRMNSDQRISITMRSMTSAGRVLLELKGYDFQAELQPSKAIYQQDL